MRVSQPMPGDIVYTLLLVVFLGFLTPAHAHNRPDLTPEERSWITHHPVIPYTVKYIWPQEYSEGGKHRGLSRDFLNNIERQTGLRFEFVPADRHPVMISSLSASLLTEKEKQGWLFSSPWMSAIPMMVARNEATHNRNLEQLHGRILAVIKGGEYAQWLQRFYPDIRLLTENTAAEAMQAVQLGKADAAIGSGLIMLPVYQRQFSDSLAITSQVPEMASGINMAVDEHYPLLLSILNKALANMSAGDVQQAYIEWFGIVELGSPTPGVLLYHYWREILFFSVLLVLLCWSLRRAFLAKKRAEKSEADKGAFLAMMSHEIRTPMNALVAALELLRHSDDRQKQRDYTELAVSSSQNLLELLNNVLDHARLTHGKPHLVTSPFALSPLLDTIVKSQEPAARKKGLALNLNLAPDLAGVWVTGDAHRLQQIINNLLSNALKFTEQGSVILTATMDERLTISVSDTGIGISPQAQQRMFLAWEQANPEVARHYGGSGLGLYISHELVKLMQGEFHLESLPGVGTTFTFSVPLERYVPSSGAPEEAPVCLLQFSPQVSILVIEDHPANQQVIAGQLELLQCHYQMVSDGDEALRLLEEENYYDVILLDCNLPGRDGYQITREIRETERKGQRSRTPVIAISALNSEEHHHRCHESGMDDVLTKPIRLQPLAEMLAKWCAADVVCYAEPAPEKHDSQPLMEWLLPDVANFTRAALEQDRRDLIHAIHRIKGVAQMYRLGALAAFSDEVEQKLRAGTDLSELPLTAWATWLDSLVKQQTPP